MSKEPSALQKLKPNPRRQAILVGLALLGISIGYGVGYLTKKEPQPEPLKAEHQKLQANPTTGNTPRVYEESLPKEIIEFPAITVPPRPVKSSKPDLLQKSIPFEQSPAILTPNNEKKLTKPKKRLRWQKHALPVILSNKPKIAIVIDDMGVDQRRSRMITQLAGPLTLSYLTYAKDLAKQTQLAKQAGHELMLHVPMEPSNPDVDPGPNVLLSGVPASETLAALKWGLSQFDGFVGVNNHMGSRFTSHLDSMKTVMQELKQRELIFLDSVTSGSTKGRIAANQIGVPFISRNIFLDHVNDINEIRSQLIHLKRLARKQGYAVAIGHPHDTTIKALKPWLKTIQNEGFQLVPISALIRLKSMSQTSSTISSNKGAQSQ